MSENVNTTIDGTRPSGCSGNPTAEKVGKTFAYCLIFFFSMAGNTVIGIIVYKTQTMRKPINFLIVNMAMSDLLVPIFLIPQQIQMLYIDSWLIGGPLGQALCKLVSLLAEASFVVSVQSLVLISVDRFGAVVFPLRSPLVRTKLYPFFILATWIIAIVVNSPHLFFNKLVEYPDGLFCEWDWNEVFGESLSVSYLLSYIVVFTFIPLVLIAMFYIIIYVKLKSQRIPGEQCYPALAEQHRQQRERNVLKMATAIVLGFAVCWLPVSVFWFILLLTDTTIWPTCGVPYFRSVVHFVAVANCAINPFICFIFSKNYRNELKALVR